MWVKGGGGLLWLELGGGLGLGLGLGSGLADAEHARTLHLLLGVHVVLEHVNVRNDVERKRVGEDLVLHVRTGRVRGHTILYNARVIYEFGLGSELHGVRGHAILYDAIWVVI